MDTEYERFLERCRLKTAEIERINSTFFAPKPELNELLESRGTAPLTTGTRLADLIKRPQLDYYCLAPFDKERPPLPEDVCEKVEIAVKYEGYISRQQAAVDEMLRLENKPIPQDFDYSTIKGLRLEAVEKLCKIRPETVGQASRISGVSPADISVLLIYLERNGINV